VKFNSQRSQKFETSKTFLVFDVQKTCITSFLLFYPFNLSSGLAASISPSILVPFTSITTSFLIIFLIFFLLLIIRRFFISSITFPSNQIFDLFLLSMILIVKPINSFLNILPVFLPDIYPFSIKTCHYQDFFYLGSVIALKFHYTFFCSSPTGKFLFELFCNFF